MTVNVLESHVEQPDHEVRRSSRSPVDRAVVAAVFLGSVAIRLPFQPDFLVNFDAVNFAFSIEDFDLEQHQPHPPGYLGYVAVARLVNTVVDDPNRSLTLISVLSSGVAVVLLYRLCRRYADVVSSGLVATLFSVSGLAWYYGLVGLTYMPAAAITLGFVVACHHARFDGDARGLYLAAVALAGLGALRQTDVVMFFPLAVFASLGVSRRARSRAGALFIGLVLVWLVPLLWLSGGPGSYVELSRDLAALAGGSTSVWSGSVAGVLTNLRLVMSGAVTGLLTVIPLLLLGRRGVVTRESSVFLALWTGPPLAVFVLIHTGQVGYVLPIVPAVHVIAAGMLTRWRRDRATPSAVGHGRAAAAALILVIVSLAVSAAGPRWMVETLRGGQSSGGDQVSVPILGDFELPAPHQVRPMSLSVHDEHWEAILTRARASDPKTTVILARLDGSARFRPLTYYLREHLVFTVGEGPSGDFGSFFSARAGETRYSVDALYDPAPWIDLPASVTRILIFDLPPDRLTTDLPSEWETVGDGTDLVTLTAPAGATLALGGTDGVWTVDVGPGS